MFGAAFDVVIVIVQRHVGIGLTCKLERLGKVVRTYDLMPSRVAQVLTVGDASAVVDGFVDHVPAGDLAFEVSNQSMDVILKACERYVSIGVLKEPRIGL